ncbi:hypothetical protein EVAR_92939_1 [Eumeta japonica]|uniref:Uncharacterized protein n=1 Tax=Eumeta variegata TaxID=151549 RepID=A0A4C1TB82_EUMVA|nr:hypothetical protein EVAR_92939_1 [Eumeta japonica]
MCVQSSYVYKELTYFMCALLENASSVLHFCVYPAVCDDLQSAKTEGLGPSDPSRWQRAARAPLMAVVVDESASIQTNGLTC